MSKQIFTIMKLEDKDYLELYKTFPEISKEDLHNSLGFTDKEAGEIYIRKTGIKDVDNATILHEAEELVSENSPHEKNGIRFGWFKKAFGFSSQPAMNVIAPLAASALLGPLGPIAAGLGGAATSALTQKTTTGSINPVGVIASGIGGAGLGAGMAKGIEASKAVGGGYLGQVGSGLQSAVGIQSGAQKALATGAGLGSNIVAPTMKAGLEATQASLPNAGTVNLGGQAYNVAGGASKGLSTVAPATINALGNISKVASQGVSTTPQAAPVVSPVSSSAVATKTFSQKIKDALTNAAVGSMTSSLVPQPTMEMPAGLEELKTKISSGKSATMLGEAARADLLKTIQTSYDELYPVSSDAYYSAVTRKTEEAYKDALEKLDAAYNLAGTYGTGEHMAQRAKLQEDLANTKSDLYAITEEGNRKLAINAKYQAVQQALGVDQNTMDDLIGATGLDVQIAAMKYGADVADVQAIREALGSLTSELMNKKQSV